MFAGSYPVFGEIAGRERAQEAGRHVDGLGKGKYGSGKVRGNVHHVGHGASVSGCNHGDCDEPNDQDKGDVTASVTNHDAEDAWHHLR